MNYAILASKTLSITEILYHTRREGYPLRVGEPEAPNSRLRVEGW
ncbi:MAG: hypothetical protein N2235_18440 [Fischerella sp.]|nr:hypothetical protein [Fischerella sp.]